MGWFDDPDETAPAVRDALDVAKDLPLPMTVRSRTRAQYAAHHRKIGVIVGAIYALFMGWILIGLALDGDPESRSILMVVAPLALLGGLLLVLAVRWRIRRSGDYRDPGIAIDIDDDGIIVRGAGGNHAIRRSDIDAKVNWANVEHGVQFMGLWIQSPLGQIDLREQTYPGGRKAAALIVRGMHEAFQARERARVETIM